MFRRLKRIANTRGKEEIEPPVTVSIKSQSMPKKIADAAPPVAAANPGPLIEHQLNVTHESTKEHSMGRQIIHDRSK